MIIVGSILICLPFMVVFLYILLNYICPGRKSVCILVLGDVGRSPRMQYHALSFAKEGFIVDLIGYGGSIPHENILKNDRINLHSMIEPPIFSKYLPRLVAYMAKVLFQAISMGLKLLFLPKHGYILLQNPPSIPTMTVAWIVCLLRGSRLVIDWHNYGYTILALTLGKTHPLVKISKWYEHFFGKLSSFNFCVTKAMSKDLKHNWNIRADTLYDRPADIFQSTSVEDQHDLYSKLSKEYDVFNSITGAKDSTLFTYKLPNGEIKKQKDRPALLISSTSWTEDEDFSILLSALKEYEMKVKENRSLPDILCVITGKGPQKEYYKLQIEQEKMEHVSFCLPWLEAEDYPKLLGCADLGVCLHMSSSGLDLPMKVVDMFGCGLPVCAIRFECISELVLHNRNGFVFDDSKQLSDQLQLLLQDFQSDNSKLADMKDHLKSFQATRWHPSWKQTVLPVFTDVNKIKQT